MADAVKDAQMLSMIQSYVVNWELQPVNGYHFLYFETSLGLYSVEILFSICKVNFFLKCDFVMYQMPYNLTGISLIF